MKREPQFTERPEEGVYIDGLYLEGARWNMDSYYIDESFSKVLYDTFPIVSNVDLTGVPSCNKLLCRITTANIDKLLFAFLTEKKI